MYGPREECSSKPQASQSRSRGRVRPTNTAIGYYKNSLRHVLTTRTRWHFNLPMGTVFHSTQTPTLTHDLSLPEEASSEPEVSKYPEFNAIIQ